MVVNVNELRENEWNWALGVEFFNFWMDKRPLFVLS